VNKSTVSTSTIRSDLDSGEKRPAWAAIGRAVGDDAADVMGADILRAENDLIDFSCAHDLGGNLHRALHLAWDGSMLTVSEPVSGDSEVLFERAS
jgi:hypothetical protein